MIEPQLLEPQPSEPASQRTDNANAAPVRLLDTQARGHIGRRVLHQQPDGELTEDPVWRWSSAPDRYLDTALRLELASSPVWRLVDSASAPVLATTLLVVASRVGERDATRRGRRIPVHGRRPRRSTRWSCGKASPCQENCPAIWPPPRAVCCSASPSRA